MPGRPTRALAMQELFFRHGHRSAFDWDTLALITQAAGFRTCERRLLARAISNRLLIPRNVDLTTLCRMSKVNQFLGSGCIDAQQVSNGRGTSRPHEGCKRSPGDLRARDLLDADLSCCMPRRARTNAAEIHEA